MARFQRLGEHGNGTGWVSAQRLRVPRNVTTDGSGARQPAGGRVVRARVGDWLITDQRGGLSVVRHTVFMRDYAPVGEGHGDTCTCDYCRPWTVTNTINADFSKPWTVTEVINDDHG